MLIDHLPDHRARRRSVIPRLLSRWRPWGLMACVLGALSSSPLHAQEGSPAAADSAIGVPERDVIDVLRSLTGRRMSDPSLSGELPIGLAWALLPSFSYNPVYGFAFGASATGAGRLSRTPHSHVSRLWTGASYSTTGQIQVEVRGDVFLHDDRYLILLDGRYLDTSRSTWGLGRVEPGQEEYEMDYRLLRGYLRLLYRIEGVVYAGVGYHTDTFSNIVDERGEAGESTPYLEYTGSLAERAHSGGLSINLLADARDNPVNPTQGYYLSSSFRSYLTDLGADMHWQELLLEFRAYPLVPARSRNRLGVWILNWFTFGDPPYLGLPYIGGDTYGRSGRGFLQGRIRARDLTYVEGEYRFDLTRDGLLGAVAFGGATWVSDPETGIFGKPNGSGGAGLRLKFNKHSDANLTVDAGWGSEGSFGIFIGMGEAF